MPLSGDLLVFANISYNITLKGHLPPLYILKIHLFTFRLHLIACGILVPQSGTEPAPPAPEAWNLSHWTAREAPTYF